MSKIELPTVTGNNNISRINDNFKKVEDALNQEVLYRKGYVGEPNEMETNLDMNGKEILNVSVGASPGSLVTKGYVDQEIAEERAYVDQELDKKFDKSGGPLSGSVDMQNNQINNLPNATQPSQPATYAQLLQVEAPGDSLLRSELAAPGGAGLVGGVPKPVTWSEFAGGADPTGVLSSDAAFSAAAAYSGEVYIPKGKYNITANHRGNFYCAEGVKFVGGGEVLAVAYPLWPTTDTPSVMTRVNRLAVGDTAVSSSAKKNPTQMSWLAQKNYLAPNGKLLPNLGWLEQNSRGTCYSSQGAIGFTAAAHNADMPASGAAIGIAGVVVNDNESTTSGGWAGYFDAQRWPGAGTTWGMEVAVANIGDYVGPYSPLNQKTIGIMLMAGADSNINGKTNDCTEAISIGGVGAHWGAGITFAGDAVNVVSEPGMFDYRRAMILRNSQRIGWESNSGQTYNWVTGKGTDYAKRTGIELRDNLIDFCGPAQGCPIVRMSCVAGDVATFRINSGQASSPLIRLRAENLTDCGIRLEAAGNGEIIINRDLRGSAANAIMCGTPASPWSGGNTQAAFTITSDERYKTAPITITDIMLDAWAEVDWVQYQFLDRVEEKGVDGARWHFGVIAQRCMEAFSRHGLDATRFAFLCHDELQSSDEVLDEEGNITIPAVEASDRYGIRYEEALALEAALQRRERKRDREAFEVFKSEVLVRLQKLEA